MFTTFQEVADAHEDYVQKYLRFKDAKRRQKNPTNPGSVHFTEFGYIGGIDKVVEFEGCILGMRIALGMDEDEIQASDELSKTVFNAAIERELGYWIKKNPEAAAYLAGFYYDQGNPLSFEEREAILTEKLELDNNFLAPSCEERVRILEGQLWEKYLERKNQVSKPVAAEAE